MLTNVYVDSESVVSKNSTKIYSGARIIKSNISDGVIVGNESRITESQIKDNVEIARRNNIQFSVIDKGTQTGENTVIQKASIGKYCAISWNVTIGGGNHFLNQLSITEKFRIFPNEQRESNGFLQEPVNIGNDVWIAAGVHVLRGVSISDGAVCGAGAVVTKDVPPYAIVAGVPARIIGYRFTDDTIKRLNKIKWWDFPEDILKECRFCFNGELNEEMLCFLESKKGIWNE